VRHPLTSERDTAEDAIRSSAVVFVRGFKGFAGKVLAELIAEGQSEPEVLRSLFDQHIGPRRAAIAADIERGKEDEELNPDADSELLIDSVFDPIFYRLLFRSAPLNERFIEELVCQVFRGVRIQAEPLTPTDRGPARKKSKAKLGTDGQLTLEEITKRPV
jgi:Tetracyclin repressor-like, C-terminal domain